MASPTRLIRLDALRALAVLLVIGHHAAFRFPPNADDYIGSTLRRVGWTGVDLFFALSGFLVVSILSKPANRADLAGFFRKRFFRIVPILVVAVGVFGTGQLLLGRSVGPLAAPLFFLTGYLYPIFHDGIPFTITWSLSVEVTAYILFALVAAQNWRRFPLFLIGLVVLCPLLRLWLIFGLGWSHLSVGYFPLGRLDTIAWGGLAALGLLGRPVRGRTGAALVVLAFLVILLTFRTLDARLIATLGLSVLGLVSALLVRVLADRDVEPSIAVGALASIGLVSYFMYLFHLFAIQCVLALSSSGLLPVGFGFWPAFLLGAALTYGAGLLSWRWFEEPLMNSAATRPWFLKDPSSDNELGNGGE